MILGSAKGGVTLPNKNNTSMAFGGAGTPTPTTTWETNSGYNTSCPPTITTTTNTNDTGQPTTGGVDACGFWANGTALSLTNTNTVSAIVTGTTGEGGSISNCLLGLTTISTTAAVADVNMTTWTPGTSTGTVCYARINEPGNWNTHIEPDHVSVTSATFTSGGTYKIVVDGTDVEFFKDGSSIRTGTVTAGTYYPFITNYRGFESGLGKYQLV